MSSISIGEALFTKTQQRVLGLLYGNPGRSFYANEVVRWAGMGRGGVRRELDRLALAGLLLTTHAGNQLHYQANAGSPVFHELHSLVVKTFGVVDVLKEALRPYADDIRFAFVYGSVASATEQPGSDIDLMVVGATAFELIVGAVYPCQQALGREINPGLFSPEEFARKMNDRNSFIAQVLEKPKLMILGTEDDIRKLGENPSA